LRCLNPWVTEVTDSIAADRHHDKRLIGAALQKARPGRSSTYQQEFTMFKTNVGSIDRILRIVAGLLLIGLAASGTIGVWGYVGVVPLLTGLLRTCPAYSLLGMSTCPTK
jgi:hypothetical protein